MAEIKHAVLALPIIGAIIAIIGAFLPWASLTISGITMAIGLLTISMTTPYGSTVLSLSDPALAGTYGGMATLGILALILIILAMAILIIGGLLAFLGKMKGKIAGALILIGGLLALLAPIIWAVGITADTPTFFQNIPIAMGFFLPIIGGILGMAAGIVGILKLD